MKHYLVVKFSSLEGTSGRCFLLFQKDHIQENCIKRSPLWQHFSIMKLTQNLRAHQDQQEFAKWLLKLGDGKIENSLQNTAPNTIALPPQSNIVTGSIVDALYPDLSAAAYLTQTVILCPTNDDTLILNELILDKLLSPKKLYLSADRALCADEKEAQNYPLEFLNSLTPSGMPPHRLNLKVDAIVMLLRNLDIRKGLCNGTRLTVKHLHEHIIIDAQILSGTNAGKRFLIPRFKLAPSDVSLPFTLERTQFP